MSKEAMKLALYALEDNFDIWTAKTKAITALREAINKSLAEQPVQTDWEAVAADQAMTIALLKAEQPAQQALDKMAENARELGLDYEQPAQRTWVGLTDFEIFSCRREDYFETYRVIEAKLRSKNEDRN